MSTTRGLMMLLLVAGCDPSPEGASNLAGGNNGSADLAMTAPDMTINNPQNPAGAGPAAVDVGSTSDVGSAGSYVILAKTGVTNVTGSAITGGQRRPQPRRRAPSSPASR